MVGARGFSRLTMGWVVVVALVWSPAQAVEFKTGEKVVIASGQVIEDDLYMTGDTMTVAGRVKGDVVASGRIVRVEGVVEGDLIAAGQLIEITGEVQDDVRIAGLTLRMGERARVGDDVIAAGFSFESAAGSQVTGDTRLMGFQAAIGGQHLQGLEASVTGLLISGTVIGDVDATVDSQAGPAWWSRFVQSPVPLPEVQPGLRLTSEARIEGDLSYRSVDVATVADAAQISGETRHEVKLVAATEKVTPRQRLAKTVRWVVVLFLLGAALLWLAPDKMIGVANTMVERPLASIGWGFVATLGFPVAMLLVLMLTSALTMAFGMLTLRSAVALVLVVGVVLILVLAAKFWVALVYLAPAAAAFAGGRWLFTRKGDEKRRYLSLLVGLVLLALLGLVPYLGSMMRWLVALIGLGAGALWSVRYLARSQAP